ncbi:3-oxoacyl-(acyl-carrier-protein) reductase [Phlyctema vagabunda]|uniref:3-oxoacyl-(Acyl-carrier-protein) reductase n=1 Tax=Phlyctema vagabunda TaxID=108571 RepID=A0ABR4PM99_9HELO
MDPFDEILGLEEQFYDQGYQQGMTEGVQAGRIEGRTFGLENGFKKYLESGRLHGKSLVWANRLPQQQQQQQQQQAGRDGARGPDAASQESRTAPEQKLSLPVLAENPRLAKHVKVIHALAESDSLSTENTEEAVSDFDDRLKRAQAKAKIIERMIGETDVDASKIVSSNDGSIEDVSVLNARH